VRWLACLGALAALASGCGDEALTSAHGGVGGSSVGNGGGAATAGGAGMGGDGGGGAAGDGWLFHRGDGEVQSATHVRVDSRDAILVAGDFSGTVDFGLGELSSASDGNDVFVVKLDSDGVALWSLQLGTTSGFNRAVLASGPSDDVVLSGHFDGSFALAGERYDAGAGNDVYVASWNSAGQLSWARSFSCDGDAFVSDAAVGGPETLVVGGSFSGTCVFDTVTLSAQVSDGFVIALDGDGDVIWARAIGGPAIGDSVWGVGTDAAGNVVAAGHFRDATDFGSGTTVMPTGVYDLYVARYGPSGDYGAQLTVDWEGTGYLDGFDMDVDVSGGAVLAGQFASVIFDVPFAGERLANQIFVARLDAADQWTHSAAFGETGVEDHVRGIGLRDDGAVALAGWAGAADFGGGVLPGFFPAFAAVLSNTGSHVYSARIGQPALTRPEDAALDHSGHLITVGAFSQAADFGFGSVTPNGTDLFILKQSLR
jgi:hypothetical protein